MAPFRAQAARVARLLASDVARNALALYAVQASAYLLPLLTLPYLARVLRPAGWGTVVFAQAFGAWLLLVLNYGFAFSATRSVAQNRADPARVARIVAGVQSAKLLLTAATALVALAAWAAVPTFRAHPAFLAWAWAAAVAQGLVPTWFFQGIERLRGAAAVDVGSRVLAAAGIFLWVRRPEDGWMVLALQAGAGALAVAATSAWMYRLSPGAARLAGFREAVETLKEGRALFVFCGAATLYTSANAFTLGLLAGPAPVAFYGAGEKLVRAASSLLGPISQALYPRINHVMAHDRGRAAEMVRRSLVPIVGFGLALGLVLAAGAPLFTRVLFGPGYQDVVPVMRVLALLPPILSVGVVLGLHWLLPLGLDRAYNRLVIGAGALNLVLAVALVPRFGALGMAVAAVLAEAFVECGIVWLVLRPGGELWPRGAVAEG